MGGAGGMLGYCLEGVGIAPTVIPKLQVSHEWLGRSQSKDHRAVVSCEGLLICLRGLASMQGLPAHPPPSCPLARSRCTAAPRYLRACHQSRRSWCWSHSRRRAGSL